MVKSFEFAEKVVQPVKISQTVLQEIVGDLRQRFHSRGQQLEVVQI